MSLKLRGGAVKDPTSDQNFRGLAQDAGAIGDRLTKVEDEGLPPTGKVGGVLGGELPNPTFAVDMATQAELDNGLALKQDASTAATDAELAVETSARESADSTEKGLREAADATEKSARETADGERTKGPASATGDDIAVFSGTTGKIVKDGGKTIAQSLDRGNHTGTQLASTVSDFDTQVRKSTLNQMTAPTADLSVNTHKLTNVLDPTENLDAANKEYVDAATSAAAAGLSVKNPVAYATTANITTTAVTATTLEGNCPLTVDGKAGPAVGLRLLIKNQSTEARNGLFEVTKEECFAGEGTFGGEGEFAVGSKWKLTRTSDADTEAEVKQGMFVLVTLGATNANTTWILTTENPVVIGTTSQTFAAFTAQPIGAAGGDLSGTYPNPQIKEGTITDTDFGSSAKELFPQLVSAAARKINFGTGELEFPGGSPEASKLITHGLGATPLFALPIFEDAGYVPGAAAYEATTFRAKAQKRDGTSPAAGTKAPFYWFAIG